MANSWNEASHMGVLQGTKITLGDLCVLLPHLQLAIAIVFAVFVYKRESTTGPAVGEREESNMGDASSPTPAVAIPEELEDEEEDLEIPDTAPIQTFLYGALELTTCRRKRIQVS
jgi:hypothetical protein